MPRRLLFDIEGDGLLDAVTKVHCIAAVDPDTGARLDWKPEDIGDALATLETADELWAHYGIGYDFPALEKVKGFKVPQHKKRDTVVAARLEFPDIAKSDAALSIKGKLPGKLVGAHSLEAWGHRLGNPKGSYEGPWDVWSPEMHTYMIQDVDVLLDLFKYLKVDEYSQDALATEHRIAQLCMQMEEWGMPFDVQGAGKLQALWMDRADVLRKELVAEFGSWYEPERKHGEIVEFTPKVNNKRLGYEKGQTMVKLEQVTFNPGSRLHAIKKLTALGWEPEAFTKSGQPKLDDEVLEDIAERFPAATKLADFLTLDKRLGALSDGDNAWLKLVSDDGMMRGRMNPMGTPHSRASHFRPNMAQVPASKSLYGKECRALFGTKHAKVKGWKQIGADMAGLQLRALGHYLTPYDGGAYGKLVTTGDPHWATTQALGLVGPDEPRDKHNGLHEILREAGGKRFIYAYVFGCQDKMAGSIIRDACVAARAQNPEWGGAYERLFGDGEDNKDVGAQARSTFDKRMMLGELQRNLMRWLRKDHQWKHHLPGLDGRWVPCRVEHRSKWINGTEHNVMTCNSALNYALSSAEAILCKTWIVGAYDELVSLGLRPGWDGDFVFNLWVHDELQASARAEVAETVGEVLKRNAKIAGEKLNFRVPIASEYKIGDTWADTH